MSNSRRRCSSVLLALSAALAATVSAGAASAQQLREMRARGAMDDALSQEIAFAAETCGNGLTGYIDWSSVRGWPAGGGLARACNSALGALEAVCREPGGRKRAAQVSSFVCAGDGAGASFHGGELRYGASPGDSGFDETKALLDSAL